MGKRAGQGVDVARLSALGLLSAADGGQRGQASLPSLCAAGALEGGLSVALDVRPDELLGPLCQRMGAHSLRVLDARTRPPELWVRVEGGREERWATPNVGALVALLNKSYRRAAGVRAVALLGEWEGAQQLWCIPKRALRALLDEGFLEAENRRELSALALE